MGEIQPMDYKQAGDRLKLEIGIFNIVGSINGGCGDQENGDRLVRK